MTSSENTPKNITDIVKEAKIETKIDSVGRVLFPAYLRNSMGLEPNSRIIIELKNGQIILYKAAEEQIS